MSDLSVFTPLIHEVVIDGRKIEVGRFKARIFSEMQTAMRPLTRLFMVKTDEGSPQMPLLDRLVGENFADVRKVVSIATGVEPEWLDAQDPHDVLTLLALVMETNADFSRRRVAPALDDLVMRVANAAKAAAATGASSSPDSESSDTEETTSST